MGFRQDENIQGLFRHLQRVAGPAPVLRSFFRADHKVIEPVGLRGPPHPENGPIPDGFRPLGLLRVILEIERDHFLRTSSQQRRPQILGVRAALIEFERTGTAVVLARGDSSPAVAVHQAPSAHPVLEILEVRD